MPTLLDGKKCAEQVLHNLQTVRSTLPNKIRLGIILVGNNATSLSYIQQKQTAGESLNISTELFSFPENTSTRTLRREIGRICRLPHMQGVIVQLSLPSSLNKQAILNAVLPTHDIDALSNTRTGHIYNNTYAILPPTVASILHLLQTYNIPIQGKTVAMVGTGTLVGRPTALVLSHKKATLLLINRSTQNPKRLIQQADIVIAGIGNPHAITPDMIRQNAVLIDAGYEKQDSKIRGDFHPDAYQKSSFYTPVPNGVGALTVAMLYANLFTLIQNTQSTRL